MIARPRFISSFFAVIALSAAALAGCGDAPRQEGLAPATRKLVVVQPAASQAAQGGASAAAPTASTRVEQRDKAQANRPAARSMGDGKMLSVKKLVLATEVEKGSREPKGVGTSFKKGEFDKLYAFVELANPGEEAQVVVFFEPPSDKPARGNVRLDVGTSPRWRTWASSKGVNEKGEWSAVVTAPDGRELAREKFEIL